MREKLSSIFLSPEVFLELFLELLLLLVLSFTLLQTFFILKKYQPGATSELNYALEKKSYLISVAVSVALVIKIFLVAFFTYSLDELSLIVPGAMCGAGVISSNAYGEPLLSLKLFILLLSCVWLLLNKADTLSKDAQYFKKKMWFFIILYILISLELLLSFNFFTLIETQNPVLCCSVIYTDITNPIPFNLSKYQLLALFTFLYTCIIFLAVKKYKIALLFVSLFFTYIAYYAIVYFFGAYIYELPTHKCPFCMLQKDYYYVGYSIYITLFLGVYKVFVLQFKFSKYDIKSLLIFFTLHVGILYAYFLMYIIRNNAFL